MKNITLKIITPNDTTMNSTVEEILVQLSSGPANLSVQMLGIGSDSGFFVSNFRVH